MSTPRISEQTLGNGLKVVAIDLPGFHSVTNFLCIRSGSRYEDQTNNGVAHFLEHMVFKGTEKFPDTLSVAQSIEGIGGHFNAWTSNDHTAYWNTVPHDEWQRGIEVPFELAFRPLMRTTDLERERGVIVEEIRRMRDEPASYVDDILGSVLFPDSSLGLSVIGTEERIKKMTLEQFQDYRAKYYHSAQSVFVVAGNLHGKDIFAEVERLTKTLQSKPVTKPSFVSSPSSKAVKLHTKKTDQTHFMLAVTDPTLGLHGPEQYVATILNAVLGQGMSSRLFLNIRERQGLAYAIRSYFSPFEDTGVIQIYCGVNTEKVSATLTALEHELSRLQNEPVGADELSKAIRMVTGSYDLTADSPSELARWYGSTRLMGLDDNLEQSKKELEAVSAEQIQELAKKVLGKERQVIAVIGPYDDDAQFRKFLNL